MFRFSVSLKCKRRKKPKKKKKKKEKKKKENEKKNVNKNEIYTIKEYISCRVMIYKLVSRQFLIRPSLNGWPIHLPE